MKLTCVGECITECDVNCGTSVAEALRILGAETDAPCGGNGKCGKCRVLCEGTLSPPDDEEKNVLGTLINDGYRQKYAAMLPFTLMRMIRVLYRSLILSCLTVLCASTSVQRT